MIHPTAMIGDNVRLGNNVYIGAYCIIGYPAEDKKHWAKVGEVVIEDDCILTGLVTVDAGTTGITTIGRGSFLMKHSHVGHDTVLEEGITVACGAKIGGRVVVMKNTNIALNATIHQRHVIGSYSMIGMGSVVPLSKSVEPFGKYAGNPIRYLGENTKLSSGLDEEYIVSEMVRYHNLCR